jgi:hypothetical protein
MMNQVNKPVGRPVGTIPGAIILGVVAALGVLTMQPLMAEQYLQSSPLVKRPAVVLSADSAVEPSVGS